MKDDCEEIPRRCEQHFTNLVAEQAHIRKTINIIKNNDLAHLSIEIGSLKGKQEILIKLVIAIFIAVVSLIITSNI